MMPKFNPKNWRFISQRQRMSPFPNYMSMEAMCSQLRRYVGLNLPAVLLFFEDRIMTGFIPLEPAKKIGEHVVGLLGRRPAMYAGLVARQRGAGKKLAGFVRVSGAGPLARLSGRKLFGFWKKFEELYLPVYAGYGSVWLVEDVLNNILLGIVRQRITDEIKAAHALNILTRQPKAMVERLEREAFYVLAGKIRQLKNGLKTTNPAARRLIKQHERKFFWVTRDYEDPALTFEKIMDKLRQAKSANPGQLLERLRSEDKRLAAERAKLKKQLCFSKAENSLFRAMLDLAYLKELRKKYVSQALFYFDPVLKEISRRSGLTLKQIRFCRTGDIRNILIKGQDYTHEVNERVRLSAWLTNRTGTNVITGPRAAKLYGLFARPRESKKVKEITGLAVSPGIARGPARLILNPDECHKVNKGDIIVSIQVVPSFSTALHKAAGLICDGGHGITTHPAILAREAGIPAIIQTRFAREILRDGDIVEVDGYQGVARIIKRK